MRVGSGVRKKQLMTVLDGVWMTPRQLSRAIGISEGACRTLMRRYQVAGLLSRRFSTKRRVEVRGRRAIEYTLSRQGRLRLPFVKTRPR